METLAELPHQALRVPPPKHRGMELGVSLRFLLEVSHVLHLGACINLLAAYG